MLVAAAYLQEQHIHLASMTVYSSFKYRIYNDNAFEIQIKSYEAIAQVYSKVIFE